MARALADPDWRARLVARQAEHACTFTWARSADLSWRALEATVAAVAPIPAPAVTARPARRPRLAYVSPMPPALLDTLSRAEIEDLLAFILNGGAQP